MTKQDQSIHFLSLLPFNYFILFYSRINNMIHLTFFCINYILFHWSFRILGLNRSFTWFAPSYLLIISSYSFILFFNTILYCEDYSYRIVDTQIKFVLLLLWNVPFNSIISYSFLIIWSALLLCLKLFLTVPMIVSNFIDIYLFGMIAVLITMINLFINFGLVLCSFLFYLFLARLQLFLLLLFILESFSHFFQSLTLANRLSINLLAGSLLVSLLTLFILHSSFSLISWSFIQFLLIIFSFEMLNYFIQWFIFCILSLEYSK